MISSARKYYTASGYVRQVPLDGIYAIPIPTCSNCSQVDPAIAAAHVVVCTSESLGSSPLAPPAAFYVTTSPRSRWRPYPPPGQCWNPLRLLEGAAISRVDTQGCRPLPVRGRPPCVTRLKCRCVDDHLVHVLSPNIYRTTSEALESFDYMSKHAYRIMLDKSYIIPGQEALCRKTLALGRDTLQNILELQIIPQLSMAEASWWFED
ncbi:hypothetical protein OPV22_003794 [Ensete ventricosum]|uniref:Uncharacterized protein n=1 Tax=Ensete ventricosum TaxID=4639 RepID=A0AAV8S1L1_ENSVE|nr:hypothetical protein OPV22_003794 [Ensete ventricosum]